MRIERPWGSYTVLNKGVGFKVKSIEVLPHRKLSLQKHKFRSEHWVVVEGKACIINDGQICYLMPNQSIYIAKESIHRLENNEGTVLKIIEVQCGDYVEEDDIERLEDEYERGSV